MKQIFSFLLFSILLSLDAAAQPSSAAPTPPARNATDVISLYSDAYTNVAGTDWFPFWGQSTVVSDVLIAGNPTKKYETLNYQGVQFSGPVNASSMTTMHVDIWTANCTAFDIFLINTSPALVEQKVTVTPTLSGWNSYDIPLSDYPNIALNNIQQMKLVGTPFGSSVVYLDNLYFWKSSNTPTLSNFNVPAKLVGDAPFTLTAPTSNSTGSFSYSSSNTNVATISGSTVTIVGAGTSVITATQAAAGGFGTGSITASLVVSFAPPSTAAPTPPARQAANVISLYSDAYTDISGIDWYPPWGQTTTVTDVQIAGNTTKKYDYLNYQGVQFSAPVDVSQMTTLHLDVWTPNCTTFEFYLINTSPSTVEQKVVLTPTLSGWNSYDIPLTQFAGVNLSSINQLKMTGLPWSNCTVYLDNIYFWKASNTPTLSGFSVPAKIIGDAPFTLTPPTSNSSGSFSYSSSNTNVATISGSTVTVVGVGTSVITATQAASGAFGSASITANLVVSFAPPTIAAPTPPLRNAPDVISLFSNAYTNVAGTDWFPNWGQSTTVTDISVAGNATKRYENLNYQGIQFANAIDASGMTHLHVDIWTPNCTAFEIALINTSPSTVEKSVTLSPSASGWNSYDIPLTSYNTINLANIGQIKLVGTPFGSSTVFLDNLYFFKQTNAPVISVTQPTCSTATGTITVLSSKTGLSFSIDGVNYANTNGIFSGVPTGTYNVTSRNASLVVSDPAVAVVNSQPITPAAPGPISGTSNIKDCDSMQTYSVTPVAGMTYRWSVSGATSGNAIVSGQNTPSVVIKMKAAGTVSVVSVNACGTKSASRKLTVINQSAATPGRIQQSFVPDVPANTNVCMFTRRVVNMTNVPATYRIRSVAGAKGYYWEAPGGSTVTRVNDTTITVVFADTISVTTASPKYINVYSLTDCDTSLARSLKLTREQVATPGVIMKNFVTNVPAVTSVCHLIGGGSEIYRIRKVAGASHYDWSLNRGSNATITRLNNFGVNDTAIMITYGNGFTRDTLKVFAVNGCNTSAAQRIYLSALNAPPTPSRIVSSTGNFSPCRGTTVQYTVQIPSPTADQTAPFRFRWTLPANATLLSSNSDSSSVSVQFGTAFTGGNLIVAARSECGIFGKSDTAYLSPVTPSAITSSTGSYNACIGNTIVYTVVTPAPDATQAAIVRYRWVIPNRTSIIAANADSSSITLQFNASYTGGNLIVRGVTRCNLLGAVKIQALTHTGCPSGSRPSNPELVSETLVGESSRSLIFPNPNNGNFSVVVDSRKEETLPATVQVIDVFGRMVANYSLAGNGGRANKALSLGNLPNGVYTVKVIVGESIKVSRMVVQK